MYQEEILIGGYKLNTQIELKLAQVGHIKFFY